MRHNSPTEFGFLTALEHKVGKSRLQGDEDWRRHVFNYPYIRFEPAFGISPEALW